MDRLIITTLSVLCFAGNLYAGVLVSQLDRGLLVLQYDSTGALQLADVQIDEGSNYGVCGTDPDATGYVDVAGQSYSVTMSVDQGWIYPCSSYDYVLTDRLTLTDVGSVTWDAITGDANLDGVFNSADLIQVMQAGHYETPRLSEANWLTGDWTLDRRFDSGDLVAAFAGNTYQAAAVPEPSGLLLFGLALLMWFRIQS